MNSFNPRVLAGGRDVRGSLIASYYPGFNPRVLAGGRDPEMPLKGEVSSVSIHASSREDATRGASCRGVSPRFQSTRPRGRTRHSLRRYFQCRRSFNPRVLAGGRDSTVLPISARCACFNPRVLAGGRDPAELLQWLSRPVSIHASSREDATRPTYPNPNQEQFQSTRPRGRTRPNTIIADRSNSSFNPRVLAGGRDF